jgi:hypothetical protein
MKQRRGYAQRHRVQLEVRVFATIVEHDHDQVLLQLTVKIPCVKGENLLSPQPTTIAMVIDRNDATAYAATERALGK